MCAGSIPEELGWLSVSKELRLSSNKLSGEAVRSSLSWRFHDQCFTFKGWCQWGVLIEFMLGSNKPSGDPMRDRCLKRTYKWAWVLAFSRVNCSRLRGLSRSDSR